MFLKLQEFCVVFEIPKLPAAVFTFELLLITLYGMSYGWWIDISLVLTDLIRGMLLEVNKFLSWLYYNMLYIGPWSYVQHDMMVHGTTTDHYRNNDTNLIVR